MFFSAVFWFGCTEDWSITPVLMLCADQIVTDREHFWLLLHLMLIIYVVVTVWRYLFLPHIYIALSYSRVSPKTIHLPTILSYEVLTNPQPFNSLSFKPFSFGLLSFFLMSVRHTQFLLSRSSFKLQSHFRCAFLQSTALHGTSDEHFFTFWIV